MWLHNVACCAKVSPMQPTLSPPTPITIGSLVHEARSAEGISMRELARRAGISAAQLSRIEAGKTLRPDQATLDALAAGLGRLAAPLHYLAGYCIPEEL